jgi:DNA polymerase
MSTSLHIDLESRGVVDLPKCGVHRYAEDPQTDIWCAAFAFGDEPIELWVPGQPCPPRIVAHVESGGTITAFNANFERVMWREILAPRYGWPAPKITQWRCVMAMALALGLPGALENAAAAVGLSIGKDMDGKANMMRMAKPRKPRKGENPLGIYWHDEEPRKQKQYAYCKNDVETERQLEKRLLPLRPSEQQLWFLDQKICDRGVYVDVELCNAALKVVEQATKWLNDEMREVTRGAVTAFTNVGELSEWLGRRGIVVTSLDKEAIDDLLARVDLPADVERALEIRREAAKASVSKIKALLRGRSADGRAKGLTIFHKASTGRWAGVRFQPHNMKKPEDGRNVDAAIDLMMSGSAEAIALVEGEPLAVVGDCLRGMVCASPGRRLTAADLTSIEGVVLPWLAGEQWKLDAFRDYIAGRAPDLYIQSYCKTFNVPLFDKDDPRRRVGKVMELASGFGGGHGAYLKMGAKGAALEKLTAIVRASTDSYDWHNAEERYDGGFGLPCDQWVALRIVIDRWRDAHPNIKALWSDLEEAFIAAVREPGKIVTCGKLQLRKAGSFLLMRLPSGRAIAYPYPKILPVKTPWGAVKDAVTYFTVPSADKKKSGKIVDDPMNTPGKWVRVAGYGGLFAENATQAVARDVLAEGMIRLETAGYPVVLHVHDEVIAEPRADFGSVDEFTRILTQVPTWLEGCPVAAGGFSAMRYRK